MAMTFTLVTHLRERLSVFMREREERIRKEEMEKERRALEVRGFSVLRHRARPNEYVFRRRKPGREALLSPSSPSGHGR